MPTEAPPKSFSNRLEKDFEAKKRPKKAYLWGPKGKTWVFGTIFAFLRQKTLSA